MSRLSTNIGYNFLGQGLVMALGFVAMKFVFVKLGDEALGIIYFAVTVNGVLTAVMELGISATTVREVSSSLDAEPRYVWDLIRTASLFYWASYVALAVATYLVAPTLIDRWVNLSTIEGTTATSALRILGVAGLVAIPRSLYMSLFRGIQRMEFNNLLDVGFMAAQQLGTIVILALGGGFLAVVYWVAASFGLGLLACVVAARRFFPTSALIPGYSGYVVTRNLRYARNMMSISLLSMVHLQSDKLIISKLLPLGYFGYYVLAYQVVAKGGALVTSAVVNAAFPSLSAHFGKGERAAMASQYRKLRDLVAYGTMPVFAGIVFFAPPLFTFVFNAEVAGILLVPVSFLALGYYMNGALSLLHIVSLAMGMPEISARANLLALFIVLPLTALLIYYFGLAGAGFSWVVYHLFAFAYTAPRICRHCLETPLLSWYLEFAKVLALALGTYGLAGLCIAMLDATSLPALVLGYLAGSAVFLAVAFYAINVELRDTLLRLLRAATTRNRDVDVA